MKKNISRVVAEKHKEFDALNKKHNDEMNVLRSLYEKGQINAALNQMVKALNTRLKLNDVATEIYNKNKLRHSRLYRKKGK